MGLVGATSTRGQQIGRVLADESDRVQYAWARVRFLAA